MKRVASKGGIGTMALSTDAPAMATKASEDSFHAYLAMLIFLSFFNYSFHTPAGFVSIVDMVAGLGLLYFFFNALTSGRLSAFNYPVVAMSVLAAALVFISNKVVHVGLDASPIVKYSIFLVLIPMTFWLSGHATPSARTYLRVIDLYTICGNLLMLFVAFNIAIGHQVGGGENIAIKLLGQSIYKNQIGEFMIFATSANFISYGIKRKFIYLLFYALALIVCLMLDIRGPILATALVSIIIYIMIFKKDASDLGKIGAFIVIMALVIYGVYVSGLFDKQLDRLFHFADAGSSSQASISSSASRIYLWRFALKLIQENPIFGVGYGGFFYDEGRGWLYGMYEPHNNILQLLSEGGVLGFGSFFLLIFLGMRSHTGSRYGVALKIIAFSYIITTLVDIVWVRGTGHLFWIAFYLFALASPSRAASVVSRQVSK